MAEPLSNPELTALVEELSGQLRDLQQTVKELEKKISTIDDYHIDRLEGLIIELQDRTRGI